MMADGFSYPPSSQGFPTSTGFGQGLAQVFNFQPLQDKLFGYEDKFIKLDEGLKQKVADEKKRIANLGQEQINAMNIDAYFTRDYATRAQVQGIVNNMQGLLKDPNVKMYLDKKMPSNPNSEALQKYKALETQFKSLKNIEEQKKAIDEANLAAFREGKIYPDIQSVHSATGQWFQTNPLSTLPQIEAANQVVRQRGAPYSAPVVPPTNLPSNLVTNAAGNVSGVSNLGAPAPGDTPLGMVTTTPSQLQIGMAQRTPGYGPSTVSTNLPSVPMNPAVVNSFLQKNNAPGVAAVSVPLPNVDIIKEMASLQPIIKQTAQSIKQELINQGGLGYDITEEMVYNTPQFRERLANTIMASNPALVRQIQQGIMMNEGRNPTLQEIGARLTDFMGINQVSQTADANEFAKIWQNAAADKDVARFKKGLESEVQLSAPDVFYPKGAGAVKASGPWEVYNFGKNMEKDLNIFDKDLKILDSNNNSIHPQVLQDVMTKYFGGSTPFVKAYYSSVGFVPSETKQGKSQLVGFYNFYLPPQNLPDGVELLSFDTKTGNAVLSDGTAKVIGVPATAMRPIEDQEAKSLGFSGAIKNTKDIAEPQNPGYQYANPGAAAPTTGMNWMSR